MKNKISSVFSVWLALLALIAFLAPAWADQGGNGSNSGSGSGNNNNNSGNGGVKIALVAGADFKGAKGSAEFRDRTRDQQFQTEIEVSKKLAGSILTVTVDGIVAGQSTVDITGHGELSLETEHGDTVPAVVVPGSVVDVMDATGDLVLSGTF